MPEQKKYTIGAYTFVIGKLSFKQLRRASTMEKKLKAQLGVVAKSQSNKKTTIEDVLTVSIAVDDIIYTDEFIEFLCVILTPEGKEWSEDMIAKHRNVMEFIDEETLGDVLRDFFTRNARLTSAINSVTA